MPIGNGRCAASDFHLEQGQEPIATAITGLLEVPLMLFDLLALPTPKVVVFPPHESKALQSGRPPRTARFEDEPGFYEPASLWLYGNTRVLDGKLAASPAIFGRTDALPAGLCAIEGEAERLVLDNQILVCGIHNPSHQRAATVPLRWGSPRILVVSGGFYHHLGKDLREEPFLAARLWRYEFDARTDLIISRRAPRKLPTYAFENPTVDRIIEKLVSCQLPGALFMSCRFHSSRGHVSSTPEALRR